MRERGGASAGGLRAWASRPIRLGAIRDLTDADWRRLILASGVLCRLAQYLADRGYWMDEASLAGNITSGGWSGLFGPMAGTQLAPPGFLAAERLAASTLGTGRLALRLVPILGGLASLFLFDRLARRVLGPTAALVALALFALGDDLIYFASELKQYETDVLAALACTLLGFRLADRPSRGPLDLALAAAAGAAAVWCSHPSAFVLAGVGSVLIVDGLRARHRRDSGGMALVCAAWAVSFAGVYAVSQGQLGHRRDMWAFWAFAFPANRLDPVWPLRRFFYLFVNPLDFGTPLGYAPSALPALAYGLIGGSSLWRRDRLGLSLLSAPLLFTAAATYLHRYPFHGRLVLFLAPSLLILIAEGAALVGRRVAGGRRQWAWALVLAPVLLFPALRAAYHLAVPRDRSDFNPRGDRRPAWLEPDRFPF